MKKNSYKSGPDTDGNFGLFGGRYVAETLMPLIIELEKAYSDALSDQDFKNEINLLNAKLLFTNKLFNIITFFFKNRKLARFY